MSVELTPQQFVSKWAGTPLKERQGYQLHFIDVCRMLGCQPPDASGLDAGGNPYAFEYGVQKNLGGQGFADVFYGGHFAIEYKAPGKHKDLKAAYQQLLQYREKLNNPPLLVVTDIENWEIHTNWPNTEKKTYRFKHEDIAARPTVWQWLRAMFDAPERLHPRRNTEQVTADAARVFKLIADNMRDWQADPDRIAHFLTKLVFCLFAEDVSLLPAGPKGETGIFTEIVERTRADPGRFKGYLADLFRAMADGGEFIFQRIPYFDGLLFEDVGVEDLSLEALTELDKAAQLDWSSVEVAIFGTLFERSLNPEKRSQLGAHYTSREDILLIVEPALMAPLRRQWAQIQARAAPIREKYEQALAGSNRRQITTYENQLQGLRQEMLTRLREITVLDPACGSGNFLYVSLQLLMDMEKEIITHELFRGMLEPMPEVHPRQMHGLELDSIAHALASIAVWIGYIQWRQNNGYMAFREPILEPLNDNIRLMDAILAYDDDGQPSEPQWPPVDVIVSNPPFLGNKRMRGELGDEYVDKLRALYNGRVPYGVDLVTYWFERARTEIERKRAKRVGLLATNSIRGGVNREVLKRIKESGDIFMAWADRPWVLEGAAVRVSMVGFDNGTEDERYLDSVPVQIINSDLTATVDITKAHILDENLHMAFQGTIKGGPFDIGFEQAQTFLRSSNSSGRSNADVVRLWMNGSDIVQRPRNMWIIDFGAHMRLEEAAEYEAPFAYVKENVLPKRENLRRKNHREYWWIHAEARPGMRQALSALSRYVITPRVAKHRIFVWSSVDVIPDSATVAIARDDDYFFGVLHSRLHEVWSLRMGTSLEDRPRYTPTTTFETFPFPWPPGKEERDHPACAAISEAARCLHAERDAWLNPPELSGKALKERTLTNLYNALNVFRGRESMKVTAAAGDFAPRLAQLHDALDRAVCAAYGWPESTLADDEDILRRLLALNLERAG
jgi:hypothetical protein